MRIIQKTEFVVFPQTLIPLSDIGSNGDRRPSKLGNQSEFLVIRVLFGHSIYMPYKDPCLLPCNNILKPCCHNITAINRRYAIVLSPYLLTSLSPHLPISSPPYLLKKHHPQCRNRSTRARVFSLSLPMSARRVRSPKARSCLRIPSISCGAKIPSCS